VSQLLWHTTQLIDLFQSWFLQTLVSSALVIAISQAYLTRPPTVREAYRAAARRFRSVFAATFLMALGMGAPIAIFACAVFAIARDPGIWLVFLVILPVVMFLGTRWSLMMPSILLEDLGGSEGLGRSWALTDRVFWKVFGTSFLAALFVILLSTLPSLAVMYGLKMFLPSTGVGSLVEIILTQLGIIVTMPLSLGVTVVLYYDLRVRKEGFDLEWQMQQAPSV
jgi:hypothetical protein